jgi:hypothetical protein
MGFLHIWAIPLGIVGLGLPLVIHWLTRPRPVRVPLSTVRFVLEAIRQRRAHHRLRDLLILAARVTAVVLLAGAFARPLIGERPLVAADESADSVRVVVLDVSQSMAAQTRGIAAFERARAKAAEYLAFRRGLRANVILAGAQPHAVFRGVSSNFAALREELGRASVRPERLNVRAALTLAAETLAQASASDGAKHELVIVSDFQAGNWAAESFDAIPAGTLVQLESVAAETLANISIQRVSVRGRAEQGHDVPVDIEVGNFSTTPRTVAVELTVGAATQRCEQLCPAGVKTTLSAEIALPAAGWQAGQARLVGVEDALAADNTRSFVLEARPAATYALVTRQPADASGSSGFYVERALAPTRPDEGAKRERVTRIDPAALDAETLAPADALVLDHPGKLSPEAVNLLVAHVRRGRPLLYVAAEPVDATNLKLLADAAGADVRLPVEFAPPAAGQTRRDRFITTLSASQPPFSVFGDAAAATLGPLRFGGGLVSRRVEGGLVDDILASFDDGSAFLVVTPCGAGTLAVLNADLGASELPRSPAFVPLMGELTGRLRGAQRGVDALPCGDPVAMHLPPDAGPTSGLSVQAPTATEANAGTGELVDEPSGVLWRWDAAGAPGVYQVLRNGAAVFALATGVPAAEGDLKALPPQTLQQQAGGTRRVSYHAAGTQNDKQDDVWGWLVTACAACVLAEWLILRMFRT